MERVFNFSAGPSVLPVDVIKKAQAELLNYNHSGMSVMELSHRSSFFQEIIDSTEEKMRNILSIPDNYQILFLQGGASLQFSMVPLNLFVKNKADYVKTGVWSKKAIQEAVKYGKVNIVASSEDENFTYIPKIDAQNCDIEADYFHITTNNTIYGTCYSEIPQTGNVPIVADMSSDIMSKKYNIEDFGLIYAGAQKNMGIGGLTLVIIRDDLLKRSEGKQTIPVMLNYHTHAEAKSLYNTPPCYAIYITKLILEWVELIGGLTAIEEINNEKAAFLYHFLDNSNFYSSVVKKNEYRSIMNIPFVLKSSEYDKLFIDEAKANGIVNIKGHRSVGGMRASIYNGMPFEGIKHLVNFMKSFELMHNNIY